MVLPNLIHPIDIQIEQWVAAQTIYDDDFREPVQQPARAAVVSLKGQPRWTTQDAIKVNNSGVEETSQGYIVFRYVDLASAGITLKNSDRIIKMGHIDTDVYIISLQPEGHYPDQDGASLLKAYFADRQPAQG